MSEITVRDEIAVSWLPGFGEADDQTKIIAGAEHQSKLLKIVTDQAELVGLIRRLPELGVGLGNVNGYQSDRIAEDLISAWMHENDLSSCISREQGANSRSCKTEANDE